MSSQATRFRFTVGQRSHHIVVERPAVVAPAPDEAMFGEPKALSIPGERRTPAKSFKDEAVSMAETLGMRHACESRSRSPLSGRSKNAPPRIRKDRSLHRTRACTLQHPLHHRPTKRAVLLANMGLDFSREAKGLAAAPGIARARRNMMSKDEAAWEHALNPAGATFFPSASFCANNPNMVTALLVSDLEGVGGVGDLKALMAGTAEHPRAQELLQLETAAAVAGLRSAGFDEVRILASHGSGSPNAVQVPIEGARWVDTEVLAPATLSGVDAVAFLGMHAAAKTDGFAAHTYRVFCAWRCQNRNLSEVEIYLGLAAERGIPAVFVAGDPILHANVESAFVATSRDRPLDPAALMAAARSAPCRLKPPPDGPIEISFKSRWQADAAAATGARRCGDYAVLVEGESFAERCQRAHTAISACEPQIIGALRGLPGSALFAEDVITILLSPWPLGACPSEKGAAERALRSFLALSDGPQSWQIADRAITLHMVRSIAPRFFASEALEPVFEDALARLARVPAQLTTELAPPEAMARLDAAYLCHLHGRSHPPIDPIALSECLPALAIFHHPLWAWLMAEIARAMGIRFTFDLDVRLFLGRNRRIDLYWLTHLFLLPSEYLRKPVLPPHAGARLQSLLLAVPWIIESGDVDLAAEIAFCLQFCGEAKAAEHGQLLRFLATAGPDAAIQAPDVDADERARVRAHAAATTLVAFAGAEEKATAALEAPS